MKKLNPQEKLFAEKFAILRNATKAAKEAKYSEKTATQMGYKLLKRPHVQAYIDKLVEKASEDAGITLQQVMMELGKIGFANIADYLTVNESGVEFFDWEGIEREKLAAIESVRETVSETVSEKSHTTSTSRLLKMCNKNQALESLAKCLGGFKDNEVTIQPTFVIKRFGKKEAVELGMGDGGKGKKAA